MQKRKQSIGYGKPRNGNIPKRGLYEKDINIFSDVSPHEKSEGILSAHLLSITSKTIYIQAELSFFGQEADFRGQPKAPRIRK